MGKINEEVQKLMRSIRHEAEGLTLRIPPANLKDEVIRLRNRLDELLEMLGGE